MALPLVVILGTTAVGKTKLAVALADELKGEIISADSRQVFQGMDIGAGKDLAEYELNNQAIPYHLINIRAAGEKYHVNAFKEDFFRVFKDVTDRQRLPILCGGTGMYIHSILQHHEFTAVPINEAIRNSLQDLSKAQLAEELKSYPEKLRPKADFSSTKRIIRAIEIAEYLTYNTLEEIKRPEINPIVIGLESELSIRRKRIIDRLDERLKAGLIAEVEQLMKDGVSTEMLTFYGLEYKFVAAHLNGLTTLDELRSRLGTAICQFAKRQMTFFRKMEKDGVAINWLNADQPFSSLKETAIQLIKHKFESN